MREVQGYWDALRATTPNLQGEVLGDLWGVEKGIYVAIIVVYSRPFGQFRHGKKIFRKPLDVDVLGIFDRVPELRAVHDGMLEARDQAVAHADTARHTTSLTVSSADSSQRESTMPYYTDGILTAKWDVLFRCVMNRCNELAHWIDTGQWNGQGVPPVKLLARR
jgi:hypothetical protein